MFIYINPFITNKNFVSFKNFLLLFICKFFWLILWRCLHNLISNKRGIPYRHPSSL
ncbi:MAG: hypothetical protein JWP71_873 [Mucilaginibacter sp.]|nr:hypothetical protein [Mucilaginibacter sp.]